jgi:hypothetical protein
MNDPPIGETSIAGLAMPISRFAAIPPNAAARGEIESMDLLAGQSVGLVKRCQASQGDCARHDDRGEAHHRDACAIKVKSAKAQGYGGCKAGERVSGPKQRIAPQE